MDMSFKLYILLSNDPEVHVVNIYKDNKDKNGYVKLNETKYFLDLLEVVHLRDYVCSIKEVSDSDKSNLKLWKVISVKSKNIKKQNIFTEENIIYELKGNEMDLEELFSNYFQDELDNKNKSESSIITIIPPVVNDTIKTLWNGNTGQSEIVRRFQFHMENDKSYHPIPVIVGGPGVGKSRFLDEVEELILKKAEEYHNNAFTNMIAINTTYGNSTVADDIDEKIQA
ncbi:3262_t:CDS:2 [Funneliformis geosporum]|uniref:16581_t:CDS:1 n=1 Tax=Funneliformis geosporum TaxID=1117311 RepID=A0A9W4T6D5_9GLOM|nr:16581_t:CDS:2 [Funneliformis geosporum]CAI2194829.1 3262_t:CDS:2 [Funneliformis geosporum]